MSFELFSLQTIIVIVSLGGNFFNQGESLTIITDALHLLISRHSSVVVWEKGIRPDFPKIAFSNFKGDYKLRYLTS